MTTPKIPEKFHKLKIRNVGNPELRSYRGEMEFYLDQKPLRGVRAFEVSAGMVAGYTHVVVARIDLAVELDMDLFPLVDIKQIIQWCGADCPCKT